ncbi:MAG TPA: CapA family protein [Anaerolineales bacterium]|nr:CapA family protein [Anaerolineales bacterium]
MRSQTALNTPGLQLALPGLSDTPTPFQPLPPTALLPSPTLANATPEGQPEPPPSIAVSGLASVWLPTYLPEALTASLALPDEFIIAPGPESAGLQLEAGEGRPVSRWVYALVAPFPTTIEGVSAQELRQSWKGEAVGPFAGEPLLVDERTQGALSAWWGEPAAGAVKVLPGNQMLQYAWDRRPSWGIVPFERLEPRWKVLEVEGSSPLRKDFDSEMYALAIPFSLNGDPALADLLLSLDQSTGGSRLGLPESNRIPGKLTTVALTGVTALVRATAFTMHRNGVTYPALDVGELLRSADLTHISNEIPFTPECPLPNPTQAGLRFCSDPSYIGLLEEVGTDIVELTGDHFGDWGPEAMRYTLSMYEDRGWIYYGGGYDRQDARRARLMEHNGNRLAFIGCNAKGGGYATASDNQPGAVACDADWMHAEIGRLQQDGYLVIATFQHFEYYTYAAQPDQIADFRGMAEAGAAIVSGSQAHRPQGIEFYQDSFIHYGLGNLFFDQYNYCTDNACNYGFIDRHVFYAGRYIGVELIPIQFVDYARPRPMTFTERQVLLEKVFSASGW